MHRIGRILLRIKKIRWRTMLAASVMLCGSFSYALAEERQYKVEAAFLYSFFNYITWPGYISTQEMQKPLICVYGDDPILPYLYYVSDKMAEERTLSVRRISDKDSAAGCHILFIRHRLSFSMTSLANDTLVVFKPDDPLDRGGMVELAEDGERISVKINQSLLEQQHFQISSRLLELAQIIK